MNYSANTTRYDAMEYRNAGSSGLKLPVLSLGLWHNFGSQADHATCTEVVTTAFDHGITHFDLANNYGPPAGSAEQRFGKILREQLAVYRDELIISSKAGYYMWPGPYGEWGSRKSIIASCDQSLKRLGVEYVDIFYHHRPDPNTPLEETMGALAQLVRQGKALYVGISNYHHTEAVKAIALLDELGLPCILNQVRYSLLDRWVEEDKLLDAMGNKAGTICFSPLAQGLLTSRYLDGSIPPDSRARENHFLKTDFITPERVVLLNELNEVAKQRGQQLNELAVSWLLKDNRVTSVLIGARNKEQLLQNLHAIEQKVPFTDEQLILLDSIVSRWK